MIPRKLPVTNTIKAGYVAYHISGNVVDDIMVMTDNKNNAYLGEPVQQIIDDGWSFMCNRAMLKKGQITTIKPSLRSPTKPINTKIKKKPILYILCGLPGSGKSTFARYYCKKQPNTMIVNRDSLRVMAYGKYEYNEDSEKMIYTMAQMCIITLLQNGFNVIIDEVNLKVAKRKAWVELGNMCGAISTILYFPEQTNNLSNRMKDPRGISKNKWKNIISNMKKDFEIPTNIEGASSHFMKDFVGHQDMSRFNV